MYLLLASRYDIMNFQRLQTTNGSYYYDYVRIGGWDSGNLTISNQAIQWPQKLGGAKHNRVVDSVCSKPCEKGKVKVRLQYERDNLYASIYIGKLTEIRNLNLNFSLQMLVSWEHIQLSQC